MADLTPRTKREQQVKSETERHREIVQTLHARQLRSAASAQAERDARDFEMAEALKHTYVGIGTLAGWTGLTHAAVYKAVRRGAEFKTPPLPF